MAYLYTLIKILYMCTCMCVLGGGVLMCMWVCVYVCMRAHVFTCGAYVHVFMCECYIVLLYSNL